MAVAAYIPNLMDRSKVAAAAQALGVDISFASSPGELDLTATLILVDLGRPGVIEALAGSGAAASDAATPGAAGAGVEGTGSRALGRSVGFASHVDRELLARGREAGCDQVLARSAFFSRLPAILSGTSDEPTTAA
jgi:hypothetical protein